MPIVGGGGGRVVLDSLELPNLVLVKIEMLRSCGQMLPRKE